MTYTGSRDPRFVRVPRGGTLDDETHRSLALWAADCAERALPLFDRVDDARPAAAIAAARAWAAGEITMMDAREHASAANAAARDSVGSAVPAARAAAHAVATAHMADHELGAAFSALRAFAAEYPGDSERLAAEKRWQLGMLAPSIRELVIDDMRRRAAKFSHAFD